MVARGDARFRILLYFVFGIAIPSGLLGYLAFRGIQNDRALVERERRTELEAQSARVAAVVHGRLEETGEAVTAAAPGDLKTLVRTRPVVEAIFTFEPARGVRVIAAKGVVFEHEPGPALSRGTDVRNGIVQRARDRELRGRDFEGALDLYGRALTEASEPETRAEALVGVARLERKLGRRVASAAAYDQLAAEFGDVVSPAGVPHGPAASLERSTLRLEMGDTAGATAALLELHHDLVDGRWHLTPSGFDMLVAATREVLEDIAVAGASAADVVLLRSLVGREESQRERALAFRAFEESASRLWRDGGPEPGLATVELGPSGLPAVLLPEAGAETVRRGFVADVPALADDAMGPALGPDADRVAWTLTGYGGERVASSATAPAPGAPTVRVALPDLSPWAVTVTPSTAAMEGGFLTSRSAIYFYAFVLLAGILLSGLTLTIRTVGRELELARLQSDFVSTVSHEFRSPLTAIRQLAEMLQSDRVPSEQRRRQYYDVLVEQSERLSLLVDSVLEFARMDSGRREMSLEPVDPEALLEDVVADARQRVAHEGFTIRTRIERPLPSLRLDRAAVRQALANVIDNGVKYSGTSRDILVRGFREDGEVVLAVRDRGIGLHRSEAERVFERFYRGGDALTRSVKGTGLGLTLVKQIVDAHGGKVEVRSVPGKGSTFAMRFPLADAGPAAPAEESL